VGQRERAVVAGDGAQLGGPVGVGGVDRELGEHGLGDAVEQGRLVRRVPVEDHRVPAKGAGEAAHGQPVGPVGIDDLQRGGQHHLPGDLALAVGGGVTCRVPKVRLSYELRRTRAPVMTWTASSTSASWSR